LISSQRYLFTIDIAIQNLPKQISSQFLKIKTMYILTLLTLPLLLLLLPIFALPTPNPNPQTSCGPNYYTAEQIQTTVNTACYYVTQGLTADGSRYPESYDDSEGFTFDGVDGPYYEFPILESGVYDGGQ
jgi:hypothetical protein